MNHFCPLPGRSVSLTVAPEPPVGAACLCGNTVQQGEDHVRCFHGDAD
jgi:hypothetical protein